MNLKSGNLAVIIMAAGKGTRMKSDLPKVLHQLHGRPMIHYVLETARSLKAEPIILIVGHRKELLISEMEEEDVLFAVQEPQLGTGHAVMCAIPELKDYEGAVLTLSGDVPFIKADTLHSLWKRHLETGASATVLTSKTQNPSGYGRIVRQKTGNLQAIIEERDASAEVRRINEINSGIYVFEIKDLRRVLPLISDDNNQREYYLTDVIHILTEEGKMVAALEGDFRETMGINTLEELENAHK